MNKLKIILLAACLPLLSLAQEAEPHIYHVATFMMKMPEGGRASERDSLLKEYFTKVTMKHPGVLHEWNMRHFFTGDSREWVVVDEYKSFKDFAAAQDKFDELEKAAYGDEAGVAAFNAKFRKYFPSHSDQIFHAIPGIVKNSAPGDKPTIFNLQTWHMVNKAGTKRSVRDSLSRIYHEKVTMKLPEVLSERHMQHYYTADSHEYVILNEVAGLPELDAAINKYDELEKAAWPDENKRKAFLEQFNDFFSYHSDKLFHSVPGLTK